RSDELDAPTRRRVEQFLRENPDAQAELDSLADFRQMITDVPAVELPAMDAATVLPKPTRSINWYRWISAAAAVALLGMIWMNTSLEVNDNGFAIHFGQDEQGAQQYASVQKELEQLRSEYHLAKAEIEKIQTALVVQTTAVATSDIAQEIQQLEARLNELSQRPRLTKTAVQKMQQQYYQEQLPRTVAAIQHSQSDGKTEWTELLDDVIAQLQEQRNNDMQALANSLLDMQRNLSNYQLATDEKLEAILTGTLSDD
ncbi:MAG: hypothetical protein AAFO94_08870, partial [Bacteroidota bacterium]